MGYLVASLTTAEATKLPDIKAISLAGYGGLPAFDEDANGYLSSKGVRGSSFELDGDAVPNLDQIVTQSKRFGLVSAIGDDFGLLELETLDVFPAASVNELAGRAKSPIFIVSASYQFARTS